MLGLGDIFNTGNQAGEMGDNLEITDLGSNFSIDHLSCGASHNCVLSIDQRIRCWGWNADGQLGYEHTNDIGDEPDEMGDNLIDVDLGAHFEPIQVECGNDFSCALSTDFNVKCWGRNYYGQLGQGDSVTRGASNGTMGDNLAIIDLGTDFNVTDIRCGAVHVCALSSIHTIKCWGDGEFGQLGLGDKLNRGDVCHITFNESNGDML